MQTDPKAQMTQTELENTLASCTRADSLHSVKWRMERLKKAKAILHDLLSQELARPKPETFKLQTLKRLKLMAKDALDAPSPQSPRVIASPA